MSQKKTHFDTETLTSHLPHASRSRRVTRSEGLHSPDHDLVIMNAMRQKCRPKHQVLILKCYPRFQKTVVDVKPNSSELSYLLYYASTRRSKLQKVGAFLEKKVGSDVYKAKLG